MRAPLIAGNWKMNGSLSLIDTFAEALSGAELPQAVTLALAVPFPYVGVARERLPQSVRLAGQTLSDQPSGAFTGEVSGAMLADVGADMVLVGHSERRTLFGEDDAAVLARVQAALGQGLTPVLCLGETLEERDAERTEAVVLGQLEAVMEALDSDERARLVLAYEPVWAIGTGRTATPEQAQQVHAAIRARLERYDGALAASMQVLYGGSMKPDNAAELLAQPDIDGGLIGGASLKVDDFLAICQSAG
ncbi:MULTISPECIES: triose-phosphate isomerase [Halomonas]|uniref:Triosephosphate isomerase n=1 Tax=Halomonas litopenaei TaxID=2109328 RepID=A0ABX5IY86_9GAMM|nr:MULTISPECIES: triose-phosphate isomerase [Halomonas]MAR71945.1 triose-phosphate isomerase [Halomonas sp.]MCO7214448.1 triose-phosphate isomerase [Halomonas sp. OfavH-34-E]PTL90170.1 triose-phosphate isomerase [Halomonas sp. SYSU XM8]PTL95524.1 triose-phosphate isomerase [Halomonas litopenaei]|tara:strand:- start:2535 stop:3281 length:747 start_codon:yes stop_codon:yes gene_type:complete